MRKLITIFCCLIVLGSSLIMNSCKKDDDSAYQLKGNYGNANVINQNYTVYNWEWTNVGTSGQAGDGYEVTEYCGLMTQSVVSSYLVMAYFSPDNSIWQPMPVTIPLGDDTYPYSETINYAYSLNTIIFGIYDNDFLTLQPDATMYFKVVAVSPQAGAAHPNVDLTNYSEVKEAFNLAD